MNLDGDLDELLTRAQATLIAAGADQQQIAAVSVARERLRMSPTAMPAASHGVWGFVDQSVEGVHVSVNILAAHNGSDESEYQAHELVDEVKRDAEGVLRLLRLVYRQKARDRD